ncbi:ubiquitin carboxyl-terminal hydrolase 15-like isoform X4 [Homarus americanus]|uniref:ubiquitin carboxyl-terminal hydrolase 15-like isoform X4 n=1 Tax=Homarus americanus TaxID=6706 RepID=UPI001C47EAA0|nr:ubiquitin carboxyl-terminal hydrolase 15-like isoform X4 [Homarus americanus]
MRRLNNTAWYDGVRQPRAHCIEQCKDSGSHVKLYNTALQYSTTTYQEGCYCCMGRVVKEAAPVHTYRTTQGNMNCCFRGTKEKSIHKKNRDDEAEIRVIRYSSQNESVISSITQINRKSSPSHPIRNKTRIPVSPYPKRPPTHGSARTYQRTSPPPPYSQVDKVGLPNLGNTCYMNAVIQCLYHTQELTQYFTSQYNERHLNSISVTGGEVARAYANVVSALNSGQKRKTALKELKNVCGIYDSQFKGNDQKEAHDLLGCLLYWLDQDLTTDELDCSCNKQGSSIKHMMNSNASKKQEALNNKALPEKQCQRDKICENCGVEFENGSVISRLFGGISQSTITCPESQNIVCQVHERFTNVSLAVTQPGNTHLQDLLRHHYRPQSIMWHCQYCQKEHMCTQQTRVLSQPQVLVIHLSRYNRVRYNAKLCGVDYPTTSLTLDEHLVHQRSSRDDRRCYRLYGVCLHTGSQTSGHYTASCRIQQRYGDHDDKQAWQIFNDEIVRPTENYKWPQTAHILFFHSDNLRKYGKWPENVDDE